MTVTSRTARLASLVLLSAAGSLSAAVTPIGITNPQSTYTENFNVGTSGAYVPITTVNGFSAYVSGGGEGDNGATGADAAYFVSYATAQSLDYLRRNNAYGSSQAVSFTGNRAASFNHANSSANDGTGYNAFGLTFVNNTGQTITSFLLSFDSYTSISTNNTHGPDGLTFSYSVGSGVPELSDGASWTNDTAFDFSFDADRTAATQNGFLSGSVGGLDWQDGQTLTLRWRDTNRPGTGATLADRGLAVDNVTLTVPEPATLAAVGGLAVTLLRRRRAD